MINKIRKWEHNKIITGQDIHKPILDIADVNYWFKLLPPKRKLFIINHYRLKKKLD